MENSINYIKEFYSKKEHDYNSILSINTDNEDTIKRIKTDIKNINKMLESKNIELHKELEKMYNTQFENVEDNIILRYCGKNDILNFDLDTGLISYEDGTIYGLNTKRGSVLVVSGYNYDLASIIVSEYRYSISKENDRIITKLVSEYVIPFMENNIKHLNIANGNIVDEEYAWNILGTCNYIENHTFINKLFGVNYEGNLSLRELRKCFFNNKSFEIIIKTAPKEIVDTLLKQEIDEVKPIHKILGISIDTYNKALERGLIKDLLDNIDIINGSKDGEYNITKTESEWLDFIEEIKTYEEDINFYGISLGGYYYGGNSLLKTILNRYCSKSILKEYYSLGKFTNYVINETINQGYSSIASFITELEDYLTMCKEDNIVPTLYSSYLSQTHDITSRNHKIKVERESEEIFKSRYKDFKKYITQDNTYMIVAPTCSDDLKHEGDNLNHCVASYIKRVIDGTCLIYFLRKKEDESLITFEVRHNAIVQVRGLHNRRPNESEIKALKEFAEERKMEVNF